VRTHTVKKPTIVFTSDKPWNSHEPGALGRQCMNGGNKGQITVGEMRVAKASGTREVRRGGADYLDFFQSRRQARKGKDDIPCKHVRRQGGRSQSEEKMSSRSGRKTETEPSLPPLGHMTQSPSSEYGRNRKGLHEKRAQKNSRASVLHDHQDEKPVKTRKGHTDGEGKSGDPPTRIHSPQEPAYILRLGRPIWGGTKHRESFGFREKK